MARRDWMALAGLVCLMGGCGASVTIEERAAGLPETPPPEMAQAALCGVAADAPLMVWTDGEAVSLIVGDGTLRALDAGVATMPADAGVTIRIDARGERVVVAASWVRVEDGIETGNTLAMFDGAGEELYRLVSEGHEANSVALSEIGELLLYRYFYDGTPGYHVVLDAEGASVSLPAGFEPETWVGPGRLRGKFDGVAAWLDDGVITQVPPGALWTRGWRGDFVALHAGKSAPWLYLESPGASELVVLWDVDSADVGKLTLRAIHDDWMLLHDDVRWWRVALPSGDTVEIDPTSPLGPAPEAMSYCAPEPVLVSSGEVVLAGGAPLSFQSLDLQGGWSLLGAPVSDVERVDAYERDGTFLLEGVVGTFCPGPVGEAHPDALAGASLQVVRPAVGAVHAIGGPAAIREGGECVAYVDDDGVHVLEVNDGHDVVVASKGGMTWWEP